MFPINGTFYIPMFYYSPQPIMMPNTQIFYPQMNIFPTSEKFSDLSNSLSGKTQIERDTQKQNENSQLYIPVENQEKTKNFMKKKLIRKKFQKCVDSTQEAQRLKRKLANRPKTYQTEKKMYLTANLSNLGILDEQKRTLRKRCQSTKRHKITDQAHSIFEISQNQENYMKKEKHESNSNEQILPHAAAKKSFNSSEFYDPHAKIPKLMFQTVQHNSEIEHKRLNLLTRKFQSNISPSS